jgi:hypothetical protein
MPCSGHGAHRRCLQRTTLSEGTGSGDGQEGQAGPAQKGAPGHRRPPAQAVEEKGRRLPVRGHICADRALLRFGYSYFEDNAGVIVNPKGEMKGSAITGPVGESRTRLSTERD